MTRIDTVSAYPRAVGRTPLAAVIGALTFALDLTEGQPSGHVLRATLVGMALGGYLSGVIYDFTGSYRAAFIHGLAWNLVNVSIAAWLLRRSLGRVALAA